LLTETEVDSCDKSKSHSTRSCSYRPNGGTVAGVEIAAPLASASAVTTGSAADTGTPPSNTGASLSQGATAPASQPADDAGELSLASLEEGAIREAQRSGDANPTAISVTRCEFAAAETALNEVATEKAVPASATNSAPWTHDAVFLIAMTGHFSFDGPTPPEAAASGGTVLALVINAHTGFILSRYVGGAMPDLEAVGHVVALKEGGAG
jgi:hypothetical protein